MSGLNLDPMGAPRSIKPPAIAAARRLATGRDSALTMIVDAVEQGLMSRRDWARTPRIFRVKHALGRSFFTRRLSRGTRRVRQNALRRAEDRQLARDMGWVR